MTKCFRCSNVAYTNITGKLLCKNHYYIKEGIQTKSLDKQEAITQQLQQQVYDQKLRTRLLRSEIEKKRMEKIYGE